MSPVSEVVAQVSQLYRASTLPPMDQNVMIEAITRSSLRRHAYSLITLQNYSESVVLELQASKIGPLVANPGRAVLSTMSIYFQPFNNLEKSTVIAIPFDQIKFIVKRRYLLRHLGLEVVSKSKFKVPDLYLLFKETEDRDSFYENLSTQQLQKMKTSNLELMQYKWKMGAVSNFEYIMHLNSEADRSVNDLTQYPVFPWIIADYVSENLDLTDAGSFRDFKKPVGALNEQRLANLKERCRCMPEPKFLYGSHYSTPGFVVFFLMRQHPQYMLCLHNGRFDNPDRMFNSLADTWSNVTTNPSDFKELIPQFYDTDGSTEFLLNRRSTSFGTRQNGKLVWDVQLPPWAKSCEHFIATMREALECNHVSSNIHHWIDLIFGYKQSGPEAVEANNVFYHLCYEGAVDLTAITDLNERLSFETQIMEFGQIPKQIFTHAHPQRNTLRSCSLNSIASLFETSSREPLAEISLGLEPVSHLLLSQKTPTVILTGTDGHLTIHTLPSLQQVGQVRLSQLNISTCAFLPSEDYVIVASWDNHLYKFNTKTHQTSDIIQAHSDGVTCLDSNEEVIVTGSWDCLCRVWEMKWPQDEIKQSTWRLQMDNLLCQMEHESAVNCVAIQPTGSRFATGTAEGLLTVWILNRDQVIHKTLCHKGAMNQLLWSPDGDYILTCGEDGQLVLISHYSGKIIWSKDFGQPIRSMTWDGRLVLIGGSHGSLIYFDVATQTQMGSFQAHQGAITSMVVWNETVITSDEEKRVLLWA